MIHKLEIEYLFEKTQTSWFYFNTECTKLETAVERAEKHFKQLVVNSGWTKKVSLVAIRPVKHANEPAPSLTVKPDVLPPARSSRGRITPDTNRASTRKKRTTKASTGTSKTKSTKPTTTRGGSSRKGTTKN